MIVLLRVTRSGRILGGSESDVKGRTSRGALRAHCPEVHHPAPRPWVEVWLSSARRLKERARPASHVDGVCRRGQGNSPRLSM